MKKFAVCVATFLLCFLSAAQEILTNQSVLQAVKNGMDDALIIEMIKSSPNNFQTGMRDFSDLKTAGVSNPVLKAMMAASKSGPSSKAVSPAMPIAQEGETGVFLESKDGQLVALKAENSEAKSTGALGFIAKGGLGSIKTGGKLEGPSSSTALSNNDSLVVKCPDGTTDPEAFYQLMSMEVKKGHREMTLAKSSFLRGSSKGSQKSVDFQKIGPGTFRVSLKEFESGEYGFMSGVGNKRVYTFSVRSSEVASAK